MTSAAGNWSVVGYGSDPVPADPASVRALADAMTQKADGWQQQLQALSSAANDGRAMKMTGDFVAPYRSRLDEHPQAARTLVQVHRTSAQALSQYAQQLQGAKNLAQSALQRGTQADQNLKQIIRNEEMINAQINSLPRVVPPPQYPAVLAQYERLQAQFQQQKVYEQQAQQQLQLARADAQRAQQQARQAEQAAAQQIQSATPKPGQQKSGGSGVVAAPAAGGPKVFKNNFDDVPKPPKGGDLRGPEVEKWLDDVTGAHPELSREGVRGIWHYTTADGYDRINKLGRNPQANLADDTAQRLAATEKGLAELPKHNGTTYRGTDLPPAVLEKLKTTGIYRDGAFTSSSQNPAVADKFARLDNGYGNPTVFTIRGTSGANITPFSATQREVEVLFPRNTPFRVVDIKPPDSGGITRIVLEEIT